MAKNNSVTGFVLGIVIVLCALSICNAKSIAREQLVRVYSAQVGVIEKTGHNDGPEVESYLKFCGLRKGNPWCAALISWCYHEAGIKALVSAYAPNWFPKVKRVPVLKARPGDVVGFFFRDKHRIAHVGFWDADAGAFAITVEGNTSSKGIVGSTGSREGDGCYRKRRLKRQIYVVSNWIDK